MRSGDLTLAPASSPSIDILNVVVELEVRRLFLPKEADE
jgi:hypothetical protein